jgi:hypothetical protein
MISGAELCNILKTIETQSSSKRQPYLKGNMFNKSDCQLLFKLRSKMLDVKTNFSNLYNKGLTCRTCKEDGVVENESHLLQCKIEDQNVEFEFVFKDVDKQRSALQAFKSVLRKREVLLEFDN